MIRRTFAALRPRLRSAALACLAIPLVASTSGCMAPVPDEGSVATRAATSFAALPPMKVFPATAHMPMPRVSNTDLARDFLDLSFNLESGRPLPVFTRVEGPIRISLSGNVPPGMARDLDQVIARMRREAGLDIARLPSGQTGNITINAVTGAQIRQQLPDAACFVVPGISHLSEYRGARRTGQTDWARMTTRDKLAIFVPADAAPQEIRDCLHEELAQSLGPLNDLYRLSYSTFNDDNIQTVLTGFDMMMLRVTYAPELHSGMTKGEVAARLPGILARINPAGAHLPSHPQAETPAAWVQAVSGALAPGGAPAARIRCAHQALAMAQAAGWNDHRTAFAYYILGRLLQVREPERAESYLEQAHAIYSRLPETRIHAAHTAVQLAAHALSVGDGDKALKLLQGRDEVAILHKNAVLLANIELLRAEALEMTGHPDQARAVRLDSLGWARYGFGPDWAVRARMQEIDAMAGISVRG